MNAGWLRILWDKWRQIWRRGRTRGWRHAWVCAKVFAINGWTRLRNHFGRYSRRECPCCGWRGWGFRAIDCGAFLVPEAECPHCFGQERHRLMAIFLEREGLPVPEGARVLHFAPERQLTDWVQKESRIGLSVNSDIDRNRISGEARPCVQLDMQRMPFADNVFDLCFCLHVMEHVPDDRIALSELRRVMKPDGTLVLMVPFMMDQTRTIEYGAPDPDMFDHVRGYSPLDFEDRLIGWRFRKIMPRDVMKEIERIRFAVPWDSQVIYLCSPEK